MSPCILSINTILCCLITFEMIFCRCFVSIPILFVLFDDVTLYTALTVCKLIFFYRSLQVDFV